MVADTAMPHGDDSSSKLTQEKLNSSSNQDKNNSNSKKESVTDLSNQCGRFSISTHATSTAEQSRDSMTPIDSISSICNNNMVTANRAGTKIKGKENMIRLSVDTQNQN